MKKTSLLLILFLIFPFLASAYIPDSNDYFNELLKKAKDGSAIEQAQVAYLYENGVIVPVDYGQALYWYKKAADQGNAIAQNNLGNLYRNGKGTPKDYTEALKWYQKSADQGNREAQYNIGACYHNGYGVPKDNNQAIYWFKKAARKGMEQAKQYLKIYEDNGIYKELVVNGKSFYISKKTLDSKYCLFTNKGEYVLTTEYDTIMAIGGDYIKVKNNGVYGVSSIDGKEIIPTSRGYTSIGDYDANKGTFAFTASGYSGQCDIQGKEISTTKNSLAQNTTTTSSNTNRTNTTTTSTASSPKYNDVATFDLKGDVKKCTSGNITYEFDRNGKYEPGNNKKVTYDNKGRISTIDEDKYEYDGLGRVKVHEGYINYLFVNLFFQHKFSYDSKGYVIKDVREDGRVFTYSDYMFDSYGNWISRKCTNPEKEVETETRAIEYYTSSMTKTNTMANNISNSSSSKTYNDYAAFGLKGKVKKCDFELSIFTYWLPFKEISFSNKGELLFAKINNTIFKVKSRYNDDKIKKIENDSGNMSYLLNYDSNGRIKSVVKSTFLLVPSETTYYLKYDYNNFIISEGKDANDLKVSYKYTKTDGQGNWTERKVDYNSNNMYDITETMTIEYY